MSAKPDLVLHPDYEGMVLPSDFARWVNLKKISDLQVEPKIEVDLLFGSDKLVKKGFELTPHYACKIGVGAKPHVTSSILAGNYPMFRILDNAPRFVIWNNTDPVSIDSTRLFRVENVQELMFELENIKVLVEKQHSISTELKDVIVFDLDMTLVDKDRKLRDGVLEVLQRAKKLFNYVVCWTHGNQEFLDCVLDMINEAFKRQKGCGFTFDLALANNFQEPTAKKSLLYLYNFFPNNLFGKCTLIDDSLFNWTPEYTNMIVPVGEIKSIESMLQIL